jgi:hypothetical protein
MQCHTQFLCQNQVLNTVSNEWLNGYDNGFRMNGLTGMITGSGQVNLLSGQIRRYRVRFGSATRCAPVNPLGHGAGRLGHAVDSAQKPNLNKKSFFFFKSVL